MRHSRRLSTHPNQPQGPFCSRCSVNLSTFPAFLRCADPACANLPVCVDCFSVAAADEAPHKPSHPYRIVEKLTQPVYASDWAAHEELRLLEALSEHGPHHWKAVADYVGKTPRKCELHYENVYLNGPNAPLATSNLEDSTLLSSPAASTDGMDDGEGLDPKPGENTAVPAANERKLKEKDSEPESGTLEGFMPLRGDFDVEWDDKAEELVSDLAFEEDDTPEERELKTRLLFMYDDRLNRRHAVKDFLFDRRLLDFSGLKYNDRRGTRDEKELSARLQVFSRLLEKNEYEAFYKSVMTEYRISRDVYRISQGRKTGMRSRAEVDLYETERKARSHRLSESAKEKGKGAGAAQKRRRTASAEDPAAGVSTPLDSVPSTPASFVNSPSKPTPPGDGAVADGAIAPNAVKIRKARERKRIARSPYPVLEAMPVEDMEHAWKLSQTEKKLCSALRIVPADFLRMRDAMLYTATETVKRRGRPKKGPPNGSVLTIRAKKQARVGKVGKDHPNASSQEPTFYLNTIPVNQPRNFVFNQIGLPLAGSAVPRVTLTCKPPNGTAVGNESAIPNGGFASNAGNSIASSVTVKVDSGTDKLHLSLKFAPPSGPKPSDPRPSVPNPTQDAEGEGPIAEDKRFTMSSVSKDADTAALLESEDLPISATISLLGKQAKAPDTVGFLGDSLELHMKRDHIEMPEETREQAQKDPEVERKKDTSDQAPEEAQKASHESDSSGEEEVVCVTSVNQARPVTRALLRRSRRDREIVTTNLTSVSRSNSPIENGAQATPPAGLDRSNVRVTTLKVKRPVTRSLSARTHSSDGASSDVPGAPMNDSQNFEIDRGASARGELRANEGPAEVPDKVLLEKATVKDLLGSSDAAPLAVVLGGRDSVIVGEDGAIRNRGCSRKSPKPSDDESSSKDEADEVLCGEDGGGAWSTGTGDCETVGNIDSHGKVKGGTRKMSSHDVFNDGRGNQRRQGSDAEELLDQGRASRDSTPGRIAGKAAMSQPSDPKGITQGSARKQPGTSRTIPQTVAKKKPRHLTQGEPGRNRKRKREIITDEKDMGGKETEVTVDGEGEGDKHDGEKYMGGKETEVTVDGEGEGDKHDGLDSIAESPSRLDGRESFEVLSSEGCEDSESHDKSDDELEEITLDEGKEEEAEDSRDATWNPKDYDAGDENAGSRDVGDDREELSIEDPTCQTELVSEPGSPDISLPDGEAPHSNDPSDVDEDRLMSRRSAGETDTVLGTRRSTRIQKRSRRFEEALEAVGQPSKRRRITLRGKRNSVVAKSPATLKRPVTIVTGGVGKAFAPAEQIQDEVQNESQRTAKDDVAPTKKRPSRQSTPAKQRQSTAERRITRSAGRQTRSRSATMKNRSLIDRVSIRKS